MVHLAFKGKTALVTGGTRGIGRAVALRLSSEGANVAVNYFSREAEAKQTLNELESAGAKAIAIAGDVSKPSEVQRLVAKVREAFGPIDILAHCAAIRRSL